ncbi:MAG: hypothetical protein WCT77_11135, partial [Bacteroidota bacterium]
MKSINMKYSILILVFLSFVLYSSPSFSKAKLSPLAKKIEKELQVQPAMKYMLAHIPLKIIKNKNYVSALIKINNSFSFSGAELLGVKFGTIAGNICTAQIPLETYLKFIRVSGLEYLESEVYACPTMDSAISVSKLKPVMQGNPPLTKPYTGKGVIVGIVDIGFDYTHPAFYDTTN